MKRSREPGDVATSPGTLRTAGTTGAGDGPGAQSAVPTPRSWHWVSGTARDRVSVVLSHGLEALSHGRPGAGPAQQGERGACPLPSDPTRDGRADGPWHTSGQQGHPRSPEVAIRGSMVAVALWVACWLRAS